MQHMELGTVGVWIDNTYTSFFIFNSFRDRGGGEAVLTG